MPRILARILVHSLILAAAPGIPAVSAAEMSAAAVDSGTVAAGFDHGPWDRLLRDHVRMGRVDYVGLLRDRSTLDVYLARVGQADPAAWPPDERKAFWINVYNARMVASVLDHWPLESVLDVGRIPILGIPTLRIFREKHDIAGTGRSLDDIEHGILRAEFADPRIHAALVCASRSCPALPSGAFAPARLDAQLDAAMRGFLQDERRNRIFEKPPRLSKIFDWYADDFRIGDGTVWDYVRGWLDDSQRRRYPEKTDVEYLSYDWSLNDDYR